MKNEVAGSNRRGFLGIFGMGVAAGPQFVQEALTKDSLSNLSLGKTEVMGSLYEKGDSSSDTEAYFGDEDDADEGSDYYTKGVDGTNYSRNYIRKLSQKLEDEAEIEFLKKNGPTVEMRLQAGQAAMQKVLKGEIPSHIKSLKSFSDSRKDRLAYEYYFKKHLEHQIESKVYDIQRRNERNAAAKYQHLYKKSKAAFLGKALKRIF